MADRTTITITPETKAILDEDRGSEPWDSYLRGLIQSNSSETESLREEHIDDIANAAARKTVDELEAVMR